ncbi:MAG: glutamate formiminotransferase, partial [Edaphobacter sp.]
AVGARNFLIAYNVHLHQPDISAARAIARDIRASNGGLHGVKAIGVVANGRAQVSMNITEFQITPMRHIYATIQHLAQRHGVLIDDAELIGLIPEEAYEADADWVKQIPGFDPALKVLERRLEHPLAWPSV